MITITTPKGNKYELTCACDEPWEFDKCFCVDPAHDDLCEECGFWGWTRDEQLRDKIEEEYPDDILDIP